MKRLAATDPGVVFLERLLLLSERNPDRLRAASAAPDYDLLRTANAMAHFQALLSAAERAGAITIRSGKRERQHLIERVTVKDALILAHHLGRKPAPMTASQTREALESVIDGAQDWVRDVLDEMQARWARSEPSFRLAPSVIEPAREFLSLLTAISKDEARGLDARTFSLRATGDTKAFERHSSRLASALVRHYSDASMGTDAIWSRIGLERFPHPVHVRGAVVVEDEDGVIVHGRAKPFASIHPTLFPMLQLCAQPTALLTIENYASFNRYVREIEDQALVVYTGGFASASVIDLLTRLLNCLDENVPFFHWGDIDPGGLRIFRFLEETLPRAPLPHLMSRELALSHGRLAVPDPTLGSIASTNSALSELAGWLAQDTSSRHLEQEALDPCSVVHRCGPQTM